MPRFSNNYEDNKIFLNFLIYEGYSGGIYDQYDYRYFIEEGLIDIVKHIKNEIKLESFDDEFFFFLFTYNNNPKKYTRHPLALFGYIECLQIGLDIKNLNLIKNMNQMLISNHYNISKIKKRLKVQNFTVFLDHPNNTLEDFINITNLLYHFNGDIQNLLWERYHQLLDNKEIIGILDNLDDLKINYPLRKTILRYLKDKM